MRPSMASFERVKTPPIPDSGPTREDVGGNRSENPKAAKPATTGLKTASQRKAAGVRSKGFASDQTGPRRPPVCSARVVREILALEMFKQFEAAHTSQKRTYGLRD